MSAPPELQRHEARYAPYYCEENVWHLCREEALAGQERRVIVVSNELRACALWGQQASERPDGLVLWDYHMVLATARARLGDDASESRGSWLVWDLDTRLGFPASLTEWLAGTFRLLPASLEALAPRFRVLGGPDFVKAFSSDRSHMRDPHGGWLHEPPDWDPITDLSRPSFLRWTQMAPGDDSLSLAALTARLAVGDSADI